MENKPQNVFEKLDKQGEQIEDISQRLEGISIEDLYALAKRTWDYEDYQTAQKYYNHISLLRPLDWEAPLYASLCNFKGYHSMDFWSHAPIQEEKIIISTIKYIDNLSLDRDEKEKEMTRCIDIITTMMQKMKEHYFKYKSDYLMVDSDYILVLEEYFLSVYNNIKNIELDSLKEFKGFLLDSLLSLVESERRITLELSRELFDELVSIASKDYIIDYDKLAEASKFNKAIKDMSYNEINEIKLKGIMYFQYNDKVIANRVKRINLVFGSILICMSILVLILAFLGTWYWAITCIAPFLLSVLLIIKVLTQKNRINCNSLLCIGREKNRLTSNGTISTDNKINLFLFAIILTYISAFFGFMMGVYSIANDEKNGFEWIYFIMSIALFILTLLNQAFVFSEYHSNMNGKYSYYYKGKYYKFDR